MFGSGLNFSQHIFNALGPIFYLGPETIMPLASILAAVAGFLLIFWRAIVNTIKKLIGKGGQPANVEEYIETEDDDEGKPGDV
ncbi:MAG: hypothetical protein MUE67_00755 [Anaerolineales bacterium]|jgi:hypothetical protein|nr:hypothetical protein [Anaerolineales bacterium]